MGEGHSGADQQRQRWQVGGKEREREIVCECERKRRRRAVKTEEVKCRLIHHSFVKDLKQNNSYSRSSYTKHKVLSLIDGQNCKNPSSYIRDIDMDMVK